MAQERSVIKFIRPCLSIHEYKNTYICVLLAVFE